MVEQSSAPNQRDQPESALASVQQAVRPARSSSSCSPVGRLPTRAPLVGRTTELDFLKAQFEEVATGGGGRLLFVSGEPGVGKTRLVRELGLYARSCGALFLEGHYLRDGTAAYGPWVEALRPGLPSLMPDELAQAVGSYGPELAQALPELVDPLGPFPPPPALPPEDRRRRLYNGITGLVSALSQRTPLVLLLDDLQWAPGLSLLAHLARRLGTSRALIMGAYREQEFKEQPALLREWADLNRDRLATQLNLAPLTEAETAQLVAHYVGDEPAGHLREPLYRRTRGNPFFVEEILRSLAESGLVRPGPAGWEVTDPSRISIPESMKLAVEERVARLGETVREVLVLGAVLGQEFSFPTLRTLTGRPEDELVEALDRALQARLLVDRSEGSEERFSFLDDQLQEVLYVGIPPLQRRRYHLRAGYALETLSAGQLEAQLEARVEELARHFAEGNDAAKAADYAIRAAEKSARLFHWVRTKQFYARALAALAHLPNTEETRRRCIDTLLKLVGVAFAIDEPGHNLSRLAQARGLAETLPGLKEPGEDSRRLASVNYWTGRLLYYQSDYRAAREYFEQARAVAYASGDEALVQICVRSIGMTLWTQGYFARAVPLLAEAIKPLEQAGNAWEWIATSGYLAQALAGCGDCAAGLAEGQRALTRAKAINDPRLLALNQLQLSVVYYLCGDHQAMLEAAQLGLQTAEQCGDQLYMYLGLGMRAWAASQLGNLEAAHTVFRTFRAVGRRLGQRLTFDDWFAAVEAEIAWRGGRLVDACRLAEQAVSWAQSVEGRFAEALSQRIWGQALAALDPTVWDEAERHLALSLRIFEEGGARLEVARTHAAWGYLCRKRGDTAAACAHLGQALPQFAASERWSDLKRLRQDLEALSRLEGVSTYLDGLTQREVEVLRLIGGGRTNREIAEELVISIATVERHVANIYNKLGVRGRVDAASYAVSRGLAKAPRL